jgi:hypothetical protein
LDEKSVSLVLYMQLVTKISFRPYNINTLWITRPSTLVNNWPTLVVFAPGVMVTPHSLLGIRCSRNFSPKDVQRILHFLKVRLFIYLFIYL